MGVSGLCQICQAREATARCDRCGTFACGQHYDESMGYCADCATEATEGGRTL